MGTDAPLSGRLAIVTGASGNLGPVWISALRNAGADVVGVDIRAAAGAPKAAGVNRTRYFARLWGPHGVRVNAPAPGGVAGGQDAEFVRKYSERVPLGRMAEPRDLVGALLFLASDASAYVTGHEL